MGIASHRNVNCCFRYSSIWVVSSFHTKHDSQKVREVHSLYLIEGCLQIFGISWSDEKSCTMLWLWDGKLRFGPILIGFVCKNSMKMTSRHHFHAFSFLLLLCNVYFNIIVSEFVVYLPRIIDSYGETLTWLFSSCGHGMDVCDTAGRVASGVWNEGVAGWGKRTHYGSCTLIECIAHVTKLIINPQLNNLVLCTLRRTHAIPRNIYIPQALAPKNYKFEIYQGHLYLAKQYLISINLKNCRLKVQRSKGPKVKPTTHKLAMPRW